MTFPQGRERALVEAAIAAREHAHAPYSDYRVGSAVETEDGTVFCGCNVEVSSYSLTCCAERTAVFSAVSAGQKRLVAVAVCTEETPPIPPCGACRQVLYDFGGRDLVVVMCNPAGDVRQTRLGALLPEAFGPEFLTE